MSVRWSCILAASAALTAASGVRAESKPTLDPAVRTRAIDGVVRCLSEGYVFPEVVRKMETAIRARMAAGVYDGIADGEELAAALTKDLRAVSHDKHIRVS